MLKRLSFLLTLIVAVSTSHVAFAQAGNFATGALLNKNWTCIRTDPSTVGPISDSKRAELILYPSSVTRKNGTTTLTYTKMQLSFTTGKFTLIAIQVFQGHKVYKRSFIKIKSIQSEQKISFSVQVPTAEMSKIVFNLTVQNPPNTSTAASCIPTSEYEKMLPVDMPRPPVGETPTTTVTP
jgi:hypothetical protein